MRAFVPQLILQTRPGFRLYRMLTRRRGGQGYPSAPWMNRVLKTPAEWELACRELDRVNLLPHPDRPKNWDSLAALDLILKRTKTEEAILDAGGETCSTLLDWLASYGHRRLVSMNLSFPRPFRRGAIQYVPGDITKTSFPDGSFGAVACLSVIEHGVNLKDYFREMSRVLRPRGVLVISTDYWESEIDTRGLRAYGAPVKVFTPQDIASAVELAGRYGLLPVSKVDLTCHEKTVLWKRMELSFTFIVLGLEKHDPAPGPQHVPVAS